MSDFPLDFEYQATRAQKMRRALREIAKICEDPRVDRRFMSVVELSDRIQKIAMEGLRG